MLLSILISLLFIPGIILLYFCFLLSLILLRKSGIREGALVTAFIIKQRRRLELIWLKFLLGAAGCITLPVLWFCYLCK